jgi:hypothetical protein
VIVVKFPFWKKLQKGVFWRITPQCMHQAITIQMKDIDLTFLNTQLTSATGFSGLPRIFRHSSFVSCSKDINQNSCDAQ